MQAKQALKVAPEDEEYWLSIRAELKPFYKNTQLANSRRGPAPTGVRDRVRSLVDLGLSYELDEYEPFTDMKESGSTLSTRSMLADYLGANSEEIALTRNAMEGILTVVQGLDFKAGDEVVATNFCYDFNLAIIRQRVARGDLRLRMVNLPFHALKPSEILASFEQTIGERTRLVSIPHVEGRTGLVFPVKEIADLARRYGALTLVDGAHGVGHLDFKLADLGADAYAACLHKHMHGPRGTGFLFVRKDAIERIWPLFASWSNKSADSIEKFEEVGTVFKALPAAIPETIAFNKRIGQAEKSARYRYLRNRWASKLREHKMVEMITDIDESPGSGFGAFVVKNVDCKHFARILLEDYDINVRAFAMEEDTSMQGIHLSPSLANSIEEVDRFVQAALEILDRLSSKVAQDPEQCRLESGRRCQFRQSSAFKY